MIPALTRPLLRLVLADAALQTAGAGAAVCLVSCHALAASLRKEIGTMRRKENHGNKEEEEQ